LNSSYVRVGYCRYIDDFIIGVTGPLSLAKTLLDRIKTFLKDTLFLNLNMKKTNISSFKKPVNFLGAMISRCPIEKKPVS
jgi:hypothetical protein